MTSTMKMLAVIAAMLTTSNAAMAGDGTKENPYTVAELNAQKDALAANGQVFWVKADLKGFGENGSLTETGSDYKDVNNLAGLFGDATGDFVAYSWQILGQLALSDLTNTKDLLISLTYGTTGHPFGNTSSPQYANNYEPETDHFSLEEVHGALSLDIQNGLRGYHIASSYVIPADVIAVKVGAGYSASKGAYVNYTDFDGNSATIITPKNSALVLKAAPGVHDFVLSAALNEQTISNGNSMSPGTQAGFNTGTTKNRACFRFVSDATKPGFQRNSDENYTVTLEAKDEVFLMVNTQETNFWGNYAWENDAKDWITWNGGQYIDTGVSPIANKTGYELGASMKSSNSTYFDLQGRRVIKPTKGIYVKNNKKRFLR